MKFLRFSSSMFYTGAVILLASCGSGNNSEKTAADSTAAADSAAKAQPVSTIITTPENVEVITHKVANYDKWLVAYDGHDSARLAAGLHNYVISRGIEDSNLVMVVTKVDDTAKAKAFAKEPSLKAAMKKGGVLGKPMIGIYTETWQDTSKIESPFRSVSSFTVKDWDTWLKAFQDGKQERTDNGISDRVVGHDLDDTKKVSVVTALIDTAKAFAYFKSDTLKKRMEAAGVIGKHTRFDIRIAKSY